MNVAAIDEYAEVRSRYEYIKGQMDDLTAAKAELDSILAKMEKEMKTIFVDAFAKINQYFGEVFTELFGGGHAEVVLSDPEDPLNCGIEINAAPPGKTLKTISLLSGGEKAFIAIALLFALIRVNPSPFCIFDEIEAALDEANVARVGRYAKRWYEGNADHHDFAPTRHHGHRGYPIRCDDAAERGLACLYTGRQSRSGFLSLTKPRIRGR
ncbi:MAG: hypothetical protein V8R75_16325 [Oscillospiraceae bacterium]